MCICGVCKPLPNALHRPTLCPYRPAHPHPSLFCDFHLAVSAWRSSVPMEFNQSLNIKWLNIEHGEEGRVPPSGDAGNYAQKRHTTERWRVWNWFLLKMIILMQSIVIINLQSHFNPWVQYMCFHQALTGCLFVYAVVQSIRELQQYYCIVYKCVWIMLI